ncbi:hypothetical protein SGLAM104S_05085 [Streptomyces glaucescens]
MSSAVDLAPQELRILVAVAEAGGFSAAAPRLCATRYPAVSHAVRGIERKLGVVLFERGQFETAPPRR